MNKVEFHGLPYRTEEDGPYRRNFSYEGGLGQMTAESDGSVSVFWHNRNSPTVVFPAEVESVYVGLEDIGFDDSATVIVKNFTLATRNPANFEPGQVIRIGR